MENKEIRYAIVIGINDYMRNPLDFCVKDAIGIRDALVNDCMFEEKNIFVISSSEDSSEKDITGKYLEALRKIKTTFVSEQDSLLFYFAGHGSCKDEKSVIWLQESPYPIEDIFSNISSLNPKIQMYIIDSCESGSKVLTRNRNTDTELQKYLQSAKGIMFLYACQNTESAKEITELEHGLLTYEVLEAIKDKSIYDDKGYLTFNRIVDFVQREISTESKFTQIPVIENSITGFYPFAIDKKKVLIKDKKPEIMEIALRENTVIKSVRARLQDKCVKKLKESLDKFNFDEYNEESISDFEELTYCGVSDLKEKIVRYVEENKLTPLADLIYKDVVTQKYNNIFGNVIKSINIMNNIPEETVLNVINFYKDSINCTIKLYLSDNITQVSFGIGYIFYQAKWGVVILMIAFQIDWDGESDNDIKSVIINDIALSLEEKSLDQVDTLNIDFNKYIKDLLNTWNEQREKELDRYRKYK